MSDALFFQNPYNGLDDRDMTRKGYRYEAFRLPDCNLLGYGNTGGIENCSIVEFDSKLWSYGGIDQYNQFLGTVLVYDLKRDFWRFGKPMKKPPPRMSHSAAFYNNSMFIFGGCNASGPLNDLWEFNFVCEMWIPWYCVPPPSRRIRHGASVYDDRMTIFGGLNPRQAQEDSALGDMWSLDISKHPVFCPPRWKEVEFHGTVPEDCQGTNTTVKHEIFVWEWNTAILSNFNYLTKTWRTVMYDEQLAGHFLVCRKFSIFSFGGTVNGSLANELKVWDMRDDDGEDGAGSRFWLCDSEGDNEPDPRRNCAGIAVGDSIYAFGGNDGEKRLCDLWRFRSWEVERDGQPVND